MKCWKCGVNLENFSWGKVPFRATCDTCGTELHCCRNCVHYKPGLPNDCNVPSTEFVADREKNNLCEDFKILGKTSQKTVDPKDVAKRLFKDD